MVAFDVGEQLTRLAIYAVPVVFAVAYHEAAHGWVACRLGDSRPEEEGRLRRNPLLHLHALWSVAVPVFLILVTNGSFVFGLARPMPIDMGALRASRARRLWVGSAGILANLGLALICGLLLAAMVGLSPESIKAVGFLRTGNVPEAPAGISGVVFLVAALVFVIGVYANVTVALLNMIPMPPLDAWRFSARRMRPEAERRRTRYERFALPGLLVVLSFPFLLFDPFQRFAEYILQLVSGLFFSLAEAIARGAA